ncbi:MAG: 16S rRNA (guanine(527)-N(7))-methyltransferase RsmG [Cycloclasticus sp.]
MFNELHRTQLERGLIEMGIELPQACVGKLMGFLQMLVKWNRVYNLSAINEPEEMVRLHILDSLAVLPFLQGARCIDVGTGAGLPGIPLAIARDDMQFSLLDSNSKKTRFIQQVCIELVLENVLPIHSRIEECLPEQKFDTVTARALTDMPGLLLKTRHLLTSGGQLLAMKSKQTEIIDSPGFQFDSVVSLEIPELEATRNLVIYTAV